MKKIILLLLITTSFIFANVKSTDTFLQESSEIYTGKTFPATIVNQIVLKNNGNPIAITSSGNFVFDGKDWGTCKDKVDLEVDKDINFPKENGKILSNVEYNKQMFVGTEKGLFVFENNNWTKVYPSDEKFSWSLTQVTVLGVDSHNRLWFGSNQGAGVLENGTWSLFTGSEGLPVKQFTCITADKRGNIWFGTERGVVRSDGKAFRYRFSRRWLPDDHVNDLVIDKKGAAWIATNNGVCKIYFDEMNYEQKADYFTNQVESRHNRDGFICQNKLFEQYQKEPYRLDISDNDGTYTAKYGAAQVFRYAVTGDKRARELALRSFMACKWLTEITHEAGFPARVIIPVDWPDPVNDIYNDAYNKRRLERDPFWKQILPRFVKSKDGKYLWKCDTSSDELAGHYFFYALFYDLAAETEHEKEMVRKVVKDVTDHLVRNGFLLRDHDGKPTRWADFSPEFVNSERGWDQRGLNSMMMLSFLNVAHHVTGDPKYKDTAKMLMDEHNYHINAMQAKMFFPPEDVVPWDNNLCLTSMYGLIKYEEDPELLLMYRESLENAWLHISKQKNALWNVLYAAMTDHFKKTVETGIYETGKVFPESGPFASFTARQYSNADCRYDDIIESLTLLPLDLIGYDMDNTHRLDVVFDPTPGQAPDMGWHYDGYALPVDERGHVRQDRDGFALHAFEGGGYQEQEGTFYLLPYYMARYYGLIE